MAANHVGRDGGSRSVIMCQANRYSTEVVSLVAVRIHLPICYMKVYLCCPFDEYSVPGQHQLKSTEIKIVQNIKDSSIRWLHHNSCVLHTLTRS